MFALSHLFLVDIPLITCLRERMWLNRDILQDLPYDQIYN